MPSVSVNSTVRNFWFSGGRLRRFRQRNARSFSAAERALKRADDRRTIEAMDKLWRECISSGPKPDFIYCNTEVYERERARNPHLFGPNGPLYVQEVYDWNDGIKIDPPQHGSVEIIE